jgi:2-isopropylmalate synthase
MDEKIRIFDTTLRDGEQAPGASLNPGEKIQIAHALADLGVDVIEAGFPITSKGDFDSVKAIASAVKGPAICGLARAVKKDIDAAAEALKKAKHGRIHVFLATSNIHMKYKLQKSKDEVYKLAVDMIKYARNLCDDVQFSAEDATRTDKDFLFHIVEAVIEAGASTVNIPDTVGYSEPQEFGQLISDIMDNVPNVGKAVIAVHCHNDLGLSVANSLAAIKSGARQVECTINGIGERAGNASLEEIVMAVKTRKDIFAGVETGIKTEHLCKISRLVSSLTGFLVAPNKAIVGYNAFRHESGIHQDGVLKERSTYEIIQPQDVGFSGSGLVLGKHSGRHALNERLKSLGFVLTDKQLDSVATRFKSLADKKKNIYDEDLVALVEDETVSVSPLWSLESFVTNSGTGVAPLAEVKLKSKGKILSAKSSGDGPVDACFKAIDKITGTKGALQDYRIEAVTSGKDAMGEVTLKVKAKGKVVAARGSSTDIIEASVRAYVNALNKIESL